MSEADIKISISAKGLAWDTLLRLTNPAAARLKEFLDHEGNADFQSDLYEALKQERRLAIRYAAPIISAHPIWERPVGFAEDGNSPGALGHPVCNTPGCGNEDYYDHIRGLIGELT